MTRRDYDIIEFLRYYKVASTDTLHHFFFHKSSLRMCQNRLKILTEKQVIGRARETINNQFLYFIRCPAQLRHALLVTDFYRELSKLCYVPAFKIEPTLGRIRPDALFGYTYNGKNQLGILEVEISHKGFNYAKYKDFDYKSHDLPVMPRVFVVGDKVKKQDGIHVITTAFAGIRSAIR